MGIVVSINPDTPICKNCNGSGIVRLFYTDLTCPLCDGSGYQPVHTEPYRIWIELDGRWRCIGGAGDEVEAQYMAACLWYPTRVEEVE